MGAYQIPQGEIHFVTCTVVELWQDGNHAEVLYSQVFISQKLNYLHENPLRAGYLTASIYYRYSSAVNYAGEKGILNVSLLDT